MADERARLMIQRAAVCGLCRGEISKVRRDDVREDLLGCSLPVMGKGGHVRMVPLPTLLAVQLLRCRPGWIFPSSTRGRPLTPARVGKLVSRTLPEGWTCHTLRHRCGTAAYHLGGIDLRAVQELLGHAKSETTDLYTKVGADSIRAAMLGASV
jgi:integrase/recombinase XerC